MHLVLRGDMVDTYGISRLKPAMYHFDFKCMTWWMTLQHGVGYLSQVLPTCGILRLQLQTVEYNEGHWDPGAG